jgi:hypothetical protein
MKDTLPSKYDARFCPRCGTRTKVICCQQQEAYFVRYRRCDECWFTYKTREVPVPYEYGERENAEVEG